MSGAKRQGGYRKSVTEDYINSLPEPEDGEDLARVRGSRGAGIFEVEILQNGLPGSPMRVELALLPNRFKNVIWVKRNDYLIVKDMTAGTSGGGGVLEVEAAGGGGGVNFEVQHVLSKDQIKHIKSVGKWPDISDAATDAGATVDDYLGMGDSEDYGEEEEMEEELKLDARGNTIDRSSNEGP